ncbi:hypothetical protein SAMN06265348_12416 [Pedobacter westerhofensis]|uniref:Uncharacterized protein n=1 Tax=Pedobacter westerhofensis TaxID=425512 RepID=A0A521FTY3_9SPHI|nr:hypothetical protein SAMN06265348_12416 [Pedobacter westerhofensis]
MNAILFDFSIKIIKQVFILLIKAYLAHEGVKINIIQIEDRPYTSHFGVIEQKKPCTTARPHR